MAPDVMEEMISVPIPNAGINFWGSLNRSSSKGKRRMQITEIEIKAINAKRAPFK